MKSRLRNLIFSAAVVALTACASLGLVTPRDFPERLAAANATTTGVVNTTTASLEQGRIGVDDAKYVSNLAKQTSTFLDAAEVAGTAGDPKTAEGRLQLAQGIITQLQQYLAKKESKP